MRLSDAVTVQIGPLDEARGIPTEVRALVEARIRQLTDMVEMMNEQIKAMEAERDVLCDFLKEETEK